MLDNWGCDYKVVNELCLSGKSETGKKTKCKKEK